MTVVEQLDAHQAPESVLLRLHQIESSIEAEEIPDEPPMPFEQRLLRWRAPVPAHVVQERFYVANDEEIVGVAHFQRWPEDDPRNSFVWIGVDPQHRRQGIARRAMSDLLARIEAAGPTMVIVDCVADRPWEQSLSRWGLTQALTERMSRLFLADVDWELMNAWIERAEERAGDYEVLHLEGPIPDGYLDEWCRINNVMNTAPLEDLDFADRIVDPARWRDTEKRMVAREDTHLATVAVHRPTGGFAGFTNVLVQRHQTDLALQNDTAVDPEHRQRGLGRLIKAAMVKRIAAEHPGVDRIHTGNAGSNAAMLGINIEMGFKTILTLNAWQGEIAPVRAHLAGP